MTFERALHRYADRIYRLALVRDGHPRQAARATVKAFMALDWSAQDADDHIEERLMAALPPVKHQRITLGRRTSDLARLPVAFWNLDPDARLALALRWSRGYDATTIASLTRRTLESTRALLEASLDRLAGVEHVADQDAACRACRWSRLDGIVPARGHLLSCARCRDDMQRWERTEHGLAESLVRLTNGVILPHPEVEQLRRFQERRTHTPRPATRVSWWRTPLVWQALVVVGVLAVVAGLVFAPSAANDQGRTEVDPRALLATALQRYGAPPEGEGVHHQQFAVQLGEGGERFQADVWTDSADPARHRMQLTDGLRVQEWQSGDGADAFRYTGTSNIWTCVPLDPRGPLDVLSVINRWTLAPAEQQTLRERRWQFGPWAVGRHYLKLATAAQEVRSLGVATEQGVRVATLSATGDDIEGSLMIKLDAESGDLREVREVRDDNGRTRIFTPWRLVEQARLTDAEATRTRVLLDYPVAERPAEVVRTLPLIDTSCPSWQKEYTFSLSSVLSSISTPLVGLPDPPAAIDRIYLGGQRDRQNNVVPESFVMVYAGAGHRLTLRTDNAGRNFAQLQTTPSVTAIASGDWRIWIRQRGLGWISGIAQYINPDPNAPRTGRSVAFYAEGWSRDEVIDILGTARQLELADVQSQQDLIFDPGTQAAGDALPALRRMIFLRPGESFSADDAVRCAVVRCTPLMTPE